MSVVISLPAAGANGNSPFEAWLGVWAASADMAYCRDLNGKILAANLAFARKFGRSTTVMSDLRVADLLHADDVGAMQGVTADLTRPPFRMNAEHRWMTPQGARWFAWEETAMRDETGTIVAIRAVGRDITRQRLAEEQFYRLSRAVEQSPVSIVITDLDGRPQYVNFKYTAVSGHTLEDILDQKIEVLRDGHPDAVSFENFWTTVRAGGEWRGELSTTSRDGGIVWESVKVSCLRGPTGDITNYLCLREDITERKKLEHELRQAQKMESLGTLAGGIAHDFNNLLAIINGYAEFCQQGRQEPAILQKSLREIHRAALRASGLVRQILTFSRKTDVRFSPVDVNQLSRDLVALLAETFPRTVTFQLDLQDRLPPLLADQNQLQQIVLNLCVNARDAMPSGGSIVLSTRTHPGSGLRHLGGDASQGYACLAVADTGTGMTPEVRQRIFEPFFTTKQGNQGTGLGLAVVYGIVVAHHGFIDVDSTPGVGSTFRVYLPLAENAVPVPVAAGSSEFPGGTESLLIVDDEESLRTLLSTALTQKGYQTRTAASGLEAIELVSDPSVKFDAVLLDLNMPGASGIEVLKVIRVCRPSLRVMVISGHLTIEARTEFEQLGQRLFVQKPYKLDEFGRNLRTLLENAAP
ncbi:PAS domain S-box protein [Horticoccus sp. 23ND18S-11]|uniref:PAS domain S-box protein n=1 Tax=Horticoccus sp. 23ND18S-11 TaxID=3391832 RepID=UPI0039C8D609